ncbi:MAG: hypothetical protein ACKPGI_15800, partial [Verrucomicrobiota bacterium]
AILDGHIVLSRGLAERNHWPAIEVLGSISRLNRGILDEGQIALQSEARDLLAVHRQNQDLINIGAYVAGMNPRLDRAVQVLPRIESFLKQGHRDSPDSAGLWNQLGEALRPAPPVTTGAASRSGRQPSLGSLRAAPNPR